MPLIQLIRHAESAANAGLATATPDSIPLTPTGQYQAQALAASFGLAPGLIVCSPYDRARLTALATAERFPATFVETWPVQEFTYLSPQRFNHSTQAQRKPHADAYWAQGDATSIDGPGAESFAQLLDRARALLHRLAAQDTDVLVFSHGQFIRAVAWLILHDADAATPARMREFRARDAGSPLGNCWSYRIEREVGGWKVRDLIDAEGRPAPPDDFCTRRQ